MVPASYKNWQEKFLKKFSKNRQKGVDNIISLWYYN